MNDIVVDITQCNEVFYSIATAVYMVVATSMMADVCNWVCVEQLHNKIIRIIFGVN